MLDFFCHMGTYTLSNYCHFSGSCNYVLLCISCRPFFFPDKLAVSWRRAAFAVIFDDDLLLSIRRKLLDLAGKLDSIVSAAFTNIEKESRQQSENIHTRCSTQTDRAFWDSLLDWNRFQHIANFINPFVCKLFNTLSKNVISVRKSPVLVSTFDAFEVLYTTAYIVLCLMDNGMDEVAEMLAKTCIMETFAPVLSITHYAEDAASDKELDSVEKHELFSTIAQCNAELFWSGNCQNGLLNVLNIFFNAIQEKSWAWSVRYTWNVAPWIDQTFATRLQENKMNSTLNVVSLEAPTAMILGLLCAVLAIDIESISSIEQVMYYCNDNIKISAITNKHNCIT